MREDLKFPDIAEWIFSAAAVAVDSDKILETENFEPLSGEALNVVEDLLGQGVPELAFLMAGTGFYVKETTVDIELLLEARRVRGFGLGIGLTGFPPAISYKARYGETENRSARLTIQVGRFGPPPLNSKT